MAASTPYQLFDMVLKRREQITPSIVNLTFTGDHLDEATTFAPDQRVKLFFGREPGEVPAMAERFAPDEDWYAAYRKLPAQERPCMRTYTIRAVRPQQKELDVEFALHGDIGPASKWACHAQPGDGLSISAPQRDYQGAPIGCEWKPPANPRHILLIGDETALPAIMGIIEELDARYRHGSRPRVQALIEVPLKSDRRPLPGWIEAAWLPREGLECQYGERLSQALRMLSLPKQSYCHVGAAELAIDIDQDILWDVSELTPEDHFYAWIASESKACLDMRRYLIDDRCIPKHQVTAMGYWRLGKVRQ